MIDDVGSGVLADDIGLLADEPAVRRSVRAGAAVVCFSGDKLLGGPQAGLLVGARDEIAACRRHPLARAVRIDKLSLAALEATLALYRDPEHARAAIPVLAMLTADEDALRVAPSGSRPSTGGTVIRAMARVGGGALPLLELQGPAVALDPGQAGADALAAALRAGDPPLVGRIQDDGCCSTRARWTTPRSTWPLRRSPTRSQAAIRPQPRRTSSNVLRVSPVTCQARLTPSAAFQGRAGRHCNHVHSPPRLACPAVHSREPSSRGPGELPVLSAWKRLRAGPPSPRIMPA